MPPQEISKSLLRPLSLSGAKRVIPIHAVNGEPGDRDEGASFVPSPRKDRGWSKTAAGAPACRLPGRGQTANNKTANNETANDKPVNDEPAGATQPN